MWQDVSGRVGERATREEEENNVMWCACVPVWVYVQEKGCLFPRYLLIYDERKTDRRKRTSNRQGRGRAGGERRVVHIYVAK